MEKTILYIIFADPISSKARMKRCPLLQGNYSKDKQRKKDCFVDDNNKSDYIHCCHMSSTMIEINICDLFQP